MAHEGITRLDLEDRTGYSYYTLCKWVAGSKPPKGDYFEKLYEACGVSESVFWSKIPLDEIGFLPTTRGQKSRASKEKQKDSAG